MILTFLVTILCSRNRLFTNIVDSIKTKESTGSFVNSYFEFSGSSYKLIINSKKYILLENATIKSSLDACMNNEIPLEVSNILSMFNHLPSNTTIKCLDIIIENKTDRIMWISNYVKNEISLRLPFILNVNCKMYDDTIEKINHVDIMITDSKMDCTLKLENSENVKSCKFNSEDVKFNECIQAFLLENNHWKLKDEALTKRFREQFPLLNFNYNFDFECRNKNLLGAFSSQTINVVFQNLKMKKFKNMDLSKDLDFALKVIIELDPFPKMTVNQLANVLLMYSAFDENLKKACLKFILSDTTTPRFYAFLYLLEQGEFISNEEYNELQQVDKNIDTLVENILRKINFSFSNENEISLFVQGMIVFNAKNLYNETKALENAHPLFKLISDIQINLNIAEGALNFPYLVDHICTNLKEFKVDLNKFLTILPVTFAIAADRNVINLKNNDELNTYTREIMKHCLELSGIDKATISGKIGEICTLN